MVTLQTQAFDTRLTDIKEQIEEFCATVNKLIKHSDIAEQVAEKRNITALLDNLTTTAGACVLPTWPELICTCMYFLTYFTKSKLSAQKFR